MSIRDEPNWSKFYDARHQNQRREHGKVVCNWHDDCEEAEEAWET